MLEPGIHIIQGALGDGKTLRAIQIAEWFITHKRRVATNINIRLERLCDPEYYPSKVVRIPDKPSVHTLENLGKGSKVRGEFGLLLLDELAIWMNSRDFNKPDRLAVIKFLIEARKRRWIVIFIAQKAQMIDKQARELGATIHTCRSTKNIMLLKWLPRMHFVNVFNTLGTKAAGTEFYRSKRLFNTYDTEQTFCDEFTGNPDPDSSDIYMPGQHETNIEKLHGAKNGYYSLIPPKLLKPALRKRASNIRSSDTTKMRMQFGAIIAALITLAMFIPSFVPEFQFMESMAQAQGEESLPSVEASLPGRELVQNPRVDPHWRYKNLTIRHYTRFGTNFRYHFKNSSGEIVRSDALENNGYRVENRGPTEALIVSPDYEYWSVFK